MDVAKITRHVRPAHVLPVLEATSKDAAVRELCALFAASGALPKAKADALAAEVLQRESEGTTGIGVGVAVPHAKTTLVKELLVAVGMSRSGLEFSAVDGEPVHVVFLIASPPDAATEYLALMKWVVSLTRAKYWMKLLRGCTTPEAMVEVLEESTAGPPPRG
jgi:mannitol/fructose-specific phosphotransferase system IIA component (Ntr-type)